MSEFEKRLTEALQRVDAPWTLAESVMAAVKAEDRVLPKAWSFAPVRAWFAPAGFALATLLLVGVVAGERVHERHEREVVATQQFEQATRITDQALQHTREQLAKVGVSLEQ